MIFVDSLKKRAYVYALFFFLSSCQAAPQWEIYRTVTFDTKYNSGRLFFTDESVRGLELELNYGLSGLRMYINVFSLEVPAAFENTNIAQVKVEFDGQFFLFMGTILAGGQRVLLSDEACGCIVDALLSGADVCLSTGQYKSLIPSSNFPGLYQALIKVPVG